MEYIDCLFLHEEIMLLSLKDQEGTIASGAVYNYAAGGAIVAELLLSERIAVEQVKKKKFVSVISPEGNSEIKMGELCSALPFF